MCKICKLDKEKFGQIVPDILACLYIGGIHHVLLLEFLGGEMFHVGRHAHGVLSGSKLLC